MKPKRTKTNLKDFNLFVSECKKWISYLELNRWDITYHHKSSKGQDAWCQAGNQIYKDSHAEIFLDTDWDLEDITEENIKLSAKHEVVHILLGQLVNCAYTRFTDSQAIRLAEEETVRILAKKIK